MYQKMAAILALVGDDLKTHFSAEPEILNLICSLDHINYTRYNTYHHVCLNDLLRKDCERYIMDMVN